MLIFPSPLPRCSLLAERVEVVLDQVLDGGQATGYPFDNGPEYISS
ncbi:conserved protein of unknown function [Pseudomonas marincola]|uniref:Uncharacterized protein n=1 Tax=Pseudomonas marincola TaxID=437900 RepID=A0A653E889_9PSED|nr:hypothetical protein [Pseudomonas marincola]CAE6918136.1 conserved protein of unknown function [Pseudomonas marincola]